MSRNSRYTIEFKSKFVENPRDANEFPLDTTLSEKLPTWKELFMALLIDVYYLNYKENGIIVPNEVKKYTLDYQKQCDNYIDFIIQAVEDTKDKSDLVPINELHDEFKEWYIEEHNDHKAPAKKEFKNYLVKRYGKDRISQSGKEIRSMRFKPDYQKRSDRNLTVVQSPPPNTEKTGMGVVI